MASQRTRTLARVLVLALTLLLISSATMPITPALGAPSAPAGSANPHSHLTVCDSSKPPFTCNPYTADFGPPNCTWFAWQLLHDLEGIDFQQAPNAAGWGIAARVDDPQHPQTFWSERTHGYIAVQLNPTPVRGDILVLPGGNPGAFDSRGHVAFVQTGLDAQGTFWVFEQNVDDYSAGPLTRPYKWTHYTLDHLSSLQTNVEATKPVFLHFPNTEVMPIAADGAQLVENLVPSITVGINQPFSLSFAELNTGNTTWSDHDQYTFSCVAQESCALMHAHDVGLGSQLIGPGHTYQFTVALTAPGSPGSYFTAWEPVHSGAPFGDVTIFLKVTVINACYRAQGGIIQSGALLTRASGSSLASTTAPADAQPPDCGAPTPTAGSGPPSGGGCALTPPVPQGPANGSSWPQSHYVTLMWTTPCPQSWVELSGGPYGVLDFGGWHGATTLDIGQMWPGAYTWHVKAGDVSGQESAWSVSWTFTIGAGSPGSTPTPGSPPSTATPGPPATPVPGLTCTTPSLSGPANGVPYPQSTDVTLSWSTTCPESYAELSGNPYGTLNFGGWHSAMSIHIGQMWPGTYSWHVKGRDSGGRETSWSGSWTLIITTATGPTPTPGPTATATSSPGATPTSTPPPNSGTLRWRYEAGAALDSSRPAVVNGVVYIGSRDSYVYALDAGTGALGWRYQTGSAVFSSPAVVNGVVYISSADSYVYALDASTGALRWRYQIGTDVDISSPTVANGIVYIGSRDSYVYALDAGTGALRWRYQTGLSVSSSPTVANGIVYVGSGDSYVYALDAGTGALGWRYQTGGVVVSSPAVANGVVYVGSDDFYVYALDAGTGALRWRYQTGFPVDSSPAVANGIVYIGSGDHYVYALDAGTGALRWRYQTGDGVVASPAVANGVVYVGSADQYFYAVDANTGALRWRYQMGGSGGSPTIVNGVVYVGSFDSHVYALWA